MKFQKLIIISVVILFFLGLLVWVYLESTKPLPGTKIDDLGREHIEVGKEVNYNSHPPTSGPHYVEWVRAGIYDKPRDDRNLVHSLEHGYVIISYDCESKKAESSWQWAVREVLAHEDEQEATGSAEAVGELPEAFSSEECKKLIGELTSVYEQKKLSTNNKLILIPHLQMDTRIALTAWNYIDKFNDFNPERITDFIDTHRGHGPEQTME